VVRIVIMGDTHGQHRTLDIPIGDFLIHVGDFTLFNRSRDEVRDFNQCLLDLPHRRKILIPGIYDFNFSDPKWRKLISAATLLLNEGVELDEIRIWGSPLTPSNFEIFRATSEADCGRIFSRIPAQTDLVISHGPPQGVLDIAGSGNRHQGCPHLLAAIRHVRLAAPCVRAHSSVLRNGVRKRDRLCECRPGRAGLSAHSAANRDRIRSANGLAKTRPTANEGTGRVAPAPAKMETAAHFQPSQKLLCEREKVGL
jgi:hypothetical protein